MAKPGRKQPLPPLTSADFYRMLRFDGWVAVKGGLVIPAGSTRPSRKVQVPKNRTGVKIGHYVQGHTASTGGRKNT